MKDNAEAIRILTEFESQRNTDVQITADNLLLKLYFNWRVELWGEGRSLLTFKRFGSDIAFATLPLSSIKPAIAAVV